MYKENEQIFGFSLIFIGNHTRLQVSLILTSNIGHISLYIPCSIYIFYLLLRLWSNIQAGALRKSNNVFQLHIFRNQMHMILWAEIPLQLPTSML